MRDLERMLEMCREGQWRPEDLDWSRSPRPMTEEEETSVVQYFTNMALIEQFAAALFREQGARVDSETLRAIFESFVGDETRHAVVARKLARYYDVSHYRSYEPAASLSRFFPRFLAAISDVSDDVANFYVTVGELVLDVALLRSLCDYVADPMTDAAMRLINRDESRHIAIDYHMFEYYASPAYQERREAKRRTAKRTRSALSFAGLIADAKPFFRDAFLAPMQHMKAEHRLREAFRRFQLLESKPDVMRLPFNRFLQRAGKIYAHPVGRFFLGPLAERIVGVGPDLIAQMNDSEALAKARAMSFEELAEDALSAKYAS
jgi:hypothetical protein